MHKLLLVLLSTTYVLSDKRIKFAAVIYRHGDRTPVDPYPNDPWKDESLWPVKFGQLTNRGKMQHYRLGKWLRKRYSHLLSSQFDPSEIHVTSTDVDRTLMSAMANLAGMYPPKHNSIWNPELLWQPVPVHTSPAQYDKVLMRQPCKAYDTEMIRYNHSRKFKKELRKYRSLMSYLTKHTGRRIKNFDDIEDIYSILQIESEYNFELPKWTHKVFPHEMKKASDLCYSVRTATPTLARLETGPFFQEIFKVMTRSFEVNSLDPSTKVAIYSAHESTVASVLNALGMFDHTCPPYTATVFIEFFGPDVVQGCSNTKRNGTVRCSSHYVRISYRKSTEIVEPKVLRIPKCGKLCPLRRFLRLYKHLIHFNWEDECNDDSSDTEKQGTIRH